LFVRGIPEDYAKLLPWFFFQPRLISTLISVLSECGQYGEAASRISRSNSGRSV